MEVGIFICKKVEDNIKTLDTLPNRRPGPRIIVSRGLPARTLTTDFPL